MVIGSGYPGQLFRPGQWLPVLVSAEGFRSFNFLSDFFSQVEHGKWLPRDPRSNPDEIMKI